jgi:hypothetical protein
MKFLYFFETDTNTNCASAQLFAIPATQTHSTRDNLEIILHLLAPCSGVVGSGAIPEAGKSWVTFPMTSVDFSVHLILPAALRTFGRLSLEQK